VTNRERARFAQAAPTAVEQTRSRLAVYLAMLKGVGALFSTSETISPDELSSYFGRLNIHNDVASRGMDGVGVIWRVAPGERLSHETAIRSKYPSYKLSSKRTNETLYPIVYFEALGPTPNKALGWDVAENEIRRAALFRAESTGDHGPSSSTPTELAVLRGSSFMSLCLVPRASLVSRE
jgi:CHASE1-domain containing sensor protein